MQLSFKIKIVVVSCENNSVVYEFFTKWGFLFGKLLLHIFFLKVSSKVVAENVEISNDFRVRERLFILIFLLNLDMFILAFAILPINLVKFKMRMKRIIFFARPVGHYNVFVFPFFNVTRRSGNTKAAMIVF